MVMQAAYRCCCPLRPTLWPHSSSEPARQAPVAAAEACQTSSWLLLNLRLLKLSTELQLPQIRLQLAQLVSVRAAVRGGAPVLPMGQRLLLKRRLVRAPALAGRRLLRPHRPRQRPAAAGLRSLRQPLLLHPCLCLLLMSKVTLPATLSARSRKPRCGAAHGQLRGQPAVQQLVVLCCKWHRSLRWARPLFKCLCL